MADAERGYEAIEVARATGKINKGANEATKALEKGKAKLVVVADDVSPKEIVMHLPVLSKEKGVPCITVPSREELGAAAGLSVATTAVVVTKEGDAKGIIEDLAKEQKQEAKKAEAPKEEKKEPTEEKAPEKPKTEEKAEEPQQESSEESSSEKEEKPEEKEAPKEESSEKEETSEEEKKAE